MGLGAAGVTKFKALICLACTGPLVGRTWMMGGCFGDCVQAVLVLGVTHDLIPAQDNPDRGSHFRPPGSGVEPDSSPPQPPLRTADSFLPRRSLLLSIHRSRHKGPGRIRDVLQSVLLPLISNPRCLYSGYLQVAYPGLTWPLLEFRTPR